MKRKSIAIITALVLSVSLVACSTDKTNDTTPSETQTEQTETVNYVLTDFVSGLKDWTVEVGAQNIDFMDGVEYNGEVVKEVTVDDNKVDLTKEGLYDIVYSIVPLDDTISKETVMKKVTVKVVSVEEAQKEADKGNQVAVSGNEVKNNSNGKTPVALKQEKPAETPKKPSANTGSNSHNNSKPSTGNNKPANNTGNTGNNNSQGGNNNNQGNDNNQGEKPHTHSWTTVNTTAGDCSHKSKVTQKCSCGETRTVDGSFGDHNYKHVAEKSHTEYKTETYTEQVPKYKWVGYYECKKCHAQFDDVETCGDHCLYDCDSTYTYLTKQVPDGYETVTKEKQVPYKVVDDPAHDECTICGKRK